MELPVGTHTVALFNSAGNRIGYKTGITLTTGTFKEVDFTKLSVADPVIEGIVGTSDSGVEGVKVELVNVAGHIMQATTTNRGGHYGFRFPAPGTYTIRITPPSGYAASPTEKTGEVKMFDTIWLDFLIRKL